MKIVSVTLQILLFFVATFVFIVLIGHGPRDFLPHAATEWSELVDLVTRNGG